MHKNTYLAQFLGMLTCARTSGQADFDHLWVGEGGNRWGIQGPWARAPCGILFLPKMVTPLRGSQPPLDNLPAPQILPPSKVQSACPCCYLSFTPGPLPTLTLCQTYLPWPTADNPLCARTKGTKSVPKLPKEDFGFEGEKNYGPIKMCFTHTPNLKVSLFLQVLPPV